MNCNFRKSFLMTFIHRMGGYPPAGSTAHDGDPGDCLSPIPLLFTRSRTLLSSFAQERNSTLFFSETSALFHKNCRVWGYLCGTSFPIDGSIGPRRPATMLLHEVPRLHDRNDLHDDGPSLRRTGDHRCVRRLPGVLVRSLREPGTLCRLHAEADQVYRGTLVARQAPAAGPAPLSAMRNGAAAGSRHAGKHAVHLLAMRGRRRSLHRFFRVPERKEFYPSTVA